MKDSDIQRIRRIKKYAARFEVIRDQYDGRYPSDHFAGAAALILAN